MAFNAKAEYFFHHVFLPPKLPQDDDSDVLHDANLLESILRAASSYSFSSGQNFASWNVVTNALIIASKIHRFDGEHVSVGHEELYAEFQTALSTNSPVHIPIYIHTQNAGLIISYKDRVWNFQAFELSPSNANVYSTNGRLKQKFPGMSIDIPTETFESNDMISAVSGLLSSLSSERTPYTMTTVRKAGHMVAETREPPLPIMIMEFLSSFLVSFGEMRAVDGIEKHVRDEIVHGGNMAPWRRSPWWLFLRVILQTLIYRAFGNLGREVYKSFMVLLMTEFMSCYYDLKENMDVTVCMAMKISHRLHKMNAAGYKEFPNLHRSVGLVLNRVFNTLSEFTKEMERDDTQIVDSRLIKSALSFIDYNITIPYGTMASIHAYRSGALEDTTLNKDWLQLEKFPSTIPSPSMFQEGDTSGFKLRLFESWMESGSFETWIVCEAQDFYKLVNLFHGYKSRADVFYSDDPVGLSRAILVLMELWVFCDTKSIAKLELFNSYQPNFNTSLLHSLLLESRRDYERLAAVEAYIQKRNADGPRKLPFQFVVNHTTSPNNLSARIFDRFAKYEQALKEIVKTSKKRCKEKMVELDMLQERYDTLIASYHSLSCWFIHYEEKQKDGQVAKEVFHDPHCIRCNYKRKAERLTILVEEDILPMDEVEQKTAVVELDPDATLVVWRDMTYYVQRRLLSETEPIKDSVYCNIRKYRPLKIWSTACRLSEKTITLSSTTKPHRNTHRRGIALSTATLSDVFLRNGMRLHFYDQRHNSLCGLNAAAEANPTLVQKLQFKMPDNAAVLQKFCQRPPTLPSGVNPNLSISELSNCPLHMSMGEFKALSSMPLGCSLQWPNILLQLTSPVVDFNKPETRIMVLQCLYSTGAPGSTPTGHPSGRAPHEFVDSTLAHNIVIAIVEATNRIKKNWACTVSMSTYVAIVTRLVAIVTDDEFLETALRWLHCCRSIMKEWIVVLQDRAKSVNVSKDIEGWLSDCVAIAAGTFSLDTPILQLVLKNQDSLMDYIEVSIMSSEMRAVSTSQIDTVLTRRWLEVRLRALPVVTRRIWDDIPVLATAIQRYWPSFSMGDQWSKLTTRPKYEHVLCCHLSSSSGGGSVMFGLLDGRLTINGHPLKTIPWSLRQHPLFIRLFKSSMFDVVPSPDSGFDLTSRQRVCGYAVHFGLEPREGQLALRIVDSEHTILDLLPESPFDTYLPENLVAGHTFWYNHTKEIIELRRDSEVWNPTSGYWSLSKNDMQHWEMSFPEKGTKTRKLIPANNQLFDAIFHVFKPLECNTKYIQITTIVNEGRHDTQTAEIEVELLRRNISFRIEPSTGDIYSKQFLGMKVAPKSYIRTLCGLYNKLILQDGRNELKEKVLVLGTTPIVRQTFSTTQIRNLKADVPAKIHVYDVDPYLGRLVDNGSLADKLFLAYIHAVTSISACPDGLTKLSGTEQALEILTSAAVQSTTVISKEAADILQKIHDLAPVRKFYPDHIRTMQLIKWDDSISLFVQDDLLSVLVSRLVHRVQEYGFLFPQTDLPAIPAPSDLVKRAVIRSRPFRSSGMLSASDFPTDNDIDFRPRWHFGSDPFSRALNCMHAARHGSVIATKQDMTKMGDTLWKSIRELPSILGPSSSSIRLHFIGYQKTLLLGASDVLESFLPLRRVLMTKQYKSGTAISLPHFVLWIGTLAFRESLDQRALQYFISLWHNNGVEFQDPPTCSDKLDLKASIPPDLQQIKDSIMSVALPVDVCPAPITMEESDSEDEDSQLQNHVYYTQRILCAQVGQYALEKWPTPKPVISICPDWQLYFDQSLSESLLHALFKKSFNNLQFQNYLSSLAIEVATWSDHQRQKKSAPAVPNKFDYEWRSLVPSDSQQLGELDDILFLNTPVHQMPDHGEAVRQQHSYSRDGDAVSKLSTRESVMATFISGLEQMVKTDHHREYVADLRSSVAAMRKMASSSSPLSDTEQYIYTVLSSLTHNFCISKAFSTSIFSTLMELRDIYQLRMHRAFEALSSSYDIHQRALGLPVSHENFLYRFRPAFFLRRLSHKHWELLPAAWRSAIVAYGVLLTQVQRLSRIMEVYTHDKYAALAELSNPGHTNWDPLEYPDSLLLEIDANIMIRSVQQDVATLMESPPDNNNCVTQLNMGEGKSSVIVPVVSSALADGSRLVCVLVGKPQAPQMLETLRGKLGGLVNRRIFQLPYARDISMSSAYAQRILNMLKDCQSTGGILLVQPEHLLSLKLAGIETLLSNKIEDMSSIVVSIQDYMDAKSRFIVDESDENFSTKFELVYTIGVQAPIEGTPQRWQTLHQVLDIIPGVAKQVQCVYHNSVEISHDRPGCFPRIRILSDDAMKMVLQLLSADICHKGLLGFPIARQSEHVRSAINQYILEFDLPKSTAAEVEQDEFTSIWGSANKSTLLLLRGIIACGVLSFGLTKKRWRVDYGLDASRHPPTRLAVPYRAKDSPSARAEFSHPDGVMMLTSLSYYYGGLSDQELFESFNHLLLNGQADIEYSTWVRGLPDLPAAFRYLSGINLHDKDHCVQQIFPCLRYGKAVIDYFLSHIVFPKEMREFPQRISASGWDLGEIKPNVTTGFSGTNDAKVLLPVDIRQHDRLSLEGTNALVLSHLLKSEQMYGMTMVYDIPKARASDKTSDAHILLSLVMSIKPQVRVIIDVGAQILELNNEGVAKAWLSQMPPDPSLEAVVFFNDNDELCVIDRKENIEPLQTSHYAHRLDLCLVFLDEAHSRGTDLKLPPDYRAAVTLGSGLTKDRLTQACMRMRKLGYTHTVSFCVPEEISNKIKTILPEHNPTSSITVSDILLWSVYETWEHTSNNIPLWGHQGIRHRRSKKLWERSRKSGNGITAEFAQRFLEPETQTLEKRYRPSYHDANDDHFLALEGFTLPKDNAIYAHATKFVGAGPKYALLGEEQERELAPEIEVERESQRPSPVVAQTPTLDHHLTTFVKTGVLQPNAGVMRAFESLQHTSVLGRVPPKLIPGNLLVTKTFASPVHGLSSYTPTRKDIFNQDSYLRPVQWVLVANVHAQSHPCLIVISPFEAQELFHTVRQSAFVSMHLYAPRINEMFPALDQLNLYVVAGNNSRFKPSVYKRLVLELNLFAGQLYFSSLEEYQDMCELLGLAARLPQAYETIAVDGFFLCDSKGRLGGNSGFLQSPVEMVRRLMHVRHEQSSIERTHVGSMLDNRFLTEDEILNDNINLNVCRYVVKREFKPSSLKSDHHKYAMVPTGSAFSARMRAQISLRKTMDHAEVSAEINRLMVKLGLSEPPAPKQTAQVANNPPSGSKAKKKKKKNNKKKSI